MKCPNCGRENAADAKVCDQCGNSLLPDQSDKTHTSTPEEQTLIEDSTRKGERRPVTVLFADVVGSTAIAEKRDPEEAKVIMEGCLNLMIDQVHRFEGYVADLLGDGIMAYFGAPIAHENDPERAIRAALGILESVTTYAEEINAAYEVNLQLRVGINTGEVVVGEVGRDQKVEYVAVGDAVNLAARMESNAPPGGVLISDSTHHLVQRIFEFEPQGKIKVKGREQPVEAYLVLGAIDHPTGTRGIEGLYSPLVGREEELAQLLEIVHTVLSGSGHIVSVLGDAGIGKSRLAQEIRTSLADKNILWLEGRALSYGKSLSLWVIQDLVRNFLGVSDADSGSITTIKLKSKVRGLFGEREREYYPYLASLLNLKLEEDIADRIADLHPEALKRRIFVVIGKLLERLAEDQPVVVILDDLHWADTSSIELLKWILPSIVKSRILLWIAARPYRDQPWWQVKIEAQTEYSQNYTEITLTPLGKEASKHLAENLLKIEDLPAGLTQSLLDKTRGNPFFLEEVIRVLMDKGVVVRQNGRWRATDKILSIEIPESVQGVLRARIDMLAEGPKELLQIASVIGKTFLHSVLEHVSGDEWELAANLQALQRAELVLEKRRLSDAEYAFKHDLTQEVAYAGLIEQRRQALHKNVAESIEALFPERLEEYFALLGHHWAASGASEKATKYLLEAGDRAHLAYAIGEAEDHYNRAIEFLRADTNDEEVAKTLMKLGFVHLLAGNYELTNSSFNKAFEAYEKKPRLQSTVEGESIRFAVFTGENEFLDPGFVETPVSLGIVRLLFDGLVNLDSDGNVVQEAAKSWEILDEGTRYVFHLQADNLWSDGSHVTAHDFEYALKRNLDPATRSRSASQFNVIRGAQDFNLGLKENAEKVGVKALDDTTLEFKLVGPIPYFLYLLTEPIASALPSKTIESHADGWTKPENIVTNGPFLLKDHQIGEVVSLDRNPLYRDAFPGNLSKIEYVLAPSLRDLVPLYESGTIDIAWVPLGDHRKVKEIHGGELQEFASLTTRFLEFNVRTPPFDEPLVRRALIHAIDRTSFADISAKYLARGGIIPPAMAGHSSEIGLTYDLEYAKQLLTEAGYPEAHDFPAFRVACIQAFAAEADFVISEWKKGLGLNVEIEFVDINELATKRETDPEQVWVNGWVADYPDANSFMRDVFHSSSPYNFTGWKSDEYDALVEEALRMPDQLRRMALYQRADEILVAEEALVMPINHSSWGFLVKPWFQNLNFNHLMRTDFREVIVDPHD